ncbi:hypothetical protein [Paenibacillus polymyxa]|nr:hypothetical protein [Paenibacillus polymyxa]
MRMNILSNQMQWRIAMFDKHKKTKRIVLETTLRLLRENDLQAT